MAVGALRIGHRSIVNLKTRRAYARRIRKAPPGAEVTIRAFAGGLSGRSIPGFSLQSPRGRSPGHRDWQAIRRVDNPPRALFTQPAGHRMMVPAHASLNQKASRPRELGPNP
jgi:hypothetical protein